jgi:hypothetical protein
VPTLRRRMGIDRYSDHRDIGQGASSAVNDQYRCYRDFYWNSRRRLISVRGLCEKRHIRVALYGGIWLVFVVPVYSTSRNQGNWAEILAVVVACLFIGIVVEFLPIGTRSQSDSK